MEQMVTVLVRAENAQSVNISHFGKQYLLKHDSKEKIPVSLYKAYMRNFTLILDAPVEKIGVEESAGHEITEEDLIEEPTDDLIEEEYEANEREMEEESKDLIEDIEDVVEESEDDEQSYEDMTYKNLQRKVSSLGGKSIGIRKDDLIEFLNKQ